MNAKIHHRFALLSLSMLLLLTPLRARAHDVLGSTIRVDVGQSRAHLQVEVPLDELGLALGHAIEVPEASLPSDVAFFERYLTDHLRVTTPSGAPFTMRAGLRPATYHDARGWFTFDVALEPPSGASARDFVIDSDLIVHRVISHHVFVLLRHDLGTGVLDSSTYLETLHYQQHRVRVDRGDASSLTALASVFRLGLEHIAAGTDHLMFLFALLLPLGLRPTHEAGRRRWGAPRSLRRSLRPAVRLVTAFTLGHSLTLALGAMDLARAPSAVVESLIAISVLVAAVHAIVPVFPEREGLLTFAFGLVHGLGFASALQDLGVDGKSLSLSLLGFNLGVEVMQALVLVVTLPVLAWLHRGAARAGTRVVLALLCAASALLWFCERAFGLKAPTMLEELGPSPVGWALLATALGSLALLVSRGLPQGRERNEPRKRARLPA